MPAIMAVGVARQRAQGQKTIRMVTALIRSPVVTYTSAAVSRATGTIQVAHRSAARITGALLFSASSTNFTTLARVVSSPTLVAFIALKF